MENDVITLLVQIVAQFCLVPWYAPFQRLLNPLVEPPPECEWSSSSPVRFFAPVIVTVPSVVCIAVLCMSRIHFEIGFVCGTTIVVSMTLPREIGFISVTWATREPSSTGLLVHLHAVHLYESELQEL